MRILENIEVLLTPSIWFTYHKYSREWDIELRYQLERETFTLPTFPLITTLGRFKIRIDDFSEAILDVCPSRKTILLARRKYQKDVIKYIREYKPE